MNSILTQTDSLRISAALGSSRLSSTFVALSRGGGRRARWVIKVLQAGDGRHLSERLRPDMIDLASLQHPFIAGPLGFGSDSKTGQDFIARSFVEGSELFRAAQGLKVKRLIPWFAAAARALSTLHRFGLLHRNLKASNFIVPKGESSKDRVREPRLVLCDAAWWPARSDREVEDAVLASEVLAGGEPVFASDLYCLGAVFYRLLTGKDPERGLVGLPPSLRRTRPDLGVDLERILAKLLHADPARRYQDARILGADLDRLSERKVMVKPVVPETFFGRSTEMARVLARLERRGEACVALMSGEAGIGKSAFLRRLALEAQLRGFRACFARCYPEAPVLSPFRTLVEQWISPGKAGKAVSARFLECLKALESNQSGERNLGADTGSRRRALRRLAELVIESAGSRPTILLVDEAHFADSSTVELLAELTHELALTVGSSVQSPLRPFLIVAFRSESPLRAAIKPLLDAAEAAKGHSLVLELDGLSEDVVEKWVECALPDDPEARERIQGGLAARGNPFAIREAIRGARPPGKEEPSPPADLPLIYDAYLRRLEGTAQDILKGLAALGRPASLEILAHAVALPPSKLRHALEGLLREGTLATEAGRYVIQHGSMQLWLQEASPETERRRRHGELARALKAVNEGSEDEVAWHWLRSDTPGLGFQTALAAARRLSRSHEERRALEIYEAILDRVDPETEGFQGIVAEEAAAAYSRIGKNLRSTELLSQVLSKSTASAEKGRLHGRIGLSYHRAGEVERAVSHLEKSLEYLAEDPSDDGLKERIRSKSELAEIASNKGCYDEAEAICNGAIAEIESLRGARQDKEVLRSHMVLLETLAHLCLRRFQYADARGLFEKSLRISEEINALSEMCLILNNLGILYNQENELRRAIECYEKAEVISKRLEDDLALLNVYSNIGLLYAKCGRLEEADEAIRRACQTDARCDSKRCRFLRLHCSGIVDLYAGRYASAIATLKEAILLGGELQDFFLIAFDLVYLGECHLLRGEMKAAQGAFARVLSLETAPPDVVIFMTRARRAILAALRGSVKEARDALSEYRQNSGSSVSFLEAWNRIYLGWAYRLLGDRDSAARELEGALTFFSQVGVPAGEIHAALELAALDADRLDVPGALRRIVALRARFECGRGPLKNPMLAGRLLLYESRLHVEDACPELEKAASLLVEAESYLIGRSFRDLESLVRDLGRRIHLAERSAAPPYPRLPAASGSSVESLEAMETFTRTASELVQRFEKALGEEDTARLRKALGDLEEHARAALRAEEGKDPRSSLKCDASSILGRSAGTRKLVEWVRQVSAGSLTVLITGETGTGKELVARAIHGESPRASAPFVSVNCAALPGDLLEAELFGYRRGAFTGAEEDRPGLVASAEGGTLFFDEVGETPGTLQAKLLRLLDRGLVRPVGAAEEVEVDVRFLFATNRNLKSLAERGEFREDLLYRIGAVEVAVPPLRDRVEDVPLLAQYFWSFVTGVSNSGNAFDDDAWRVLAGYPWPGNIRELHNVVAQLALTTAPPVRPEDVKQILRKKPSSGLFSSAFLRSRPLSALVTQLEREYFLQLKADSGGDAKSMASRLGVSVQALYKRFKTLGIRPGGRAQSRGERSP